MVDKRDEVAAFKKQILGHPGQAVPTLWLSGPCPGCLRVTYSFVPAVWALALISQGTKDRGLKPRASTPGTTSIRGLGPSSSHSHVLEAPYFLSWPQFLCQTGPWGALRKQGKGSPRQHGPLVDSSSDYPWRGQGHGTIIIISKR